MISDTNIKGMIFRICIVTILSVSRLLNIDSRRGGCVEPRVISFKIR